jgi:hypothetical protein
MNRVHQFIKKHTRRMELLYKKTLICKHECPELMEEYFKLADRERMMINCANGLIVNSMIVAIRNEYLNKKK